MAAMDANKAESRSPHGERGLKFLEDNGIDIGLVSLPTRGAWIEIFFACPLTVQPCHVAPHTGSVD